MPSIYDHHDKAFDSVSAFVVLNEYREKVATIAFKFPKDGAGRLWCYAQWMGLEMARGYAGGYGYDKRSAAAASAARNLPKPDASAKYADGTSHYTANQIEAHGRFIAALENDNGHEWDSRLREAGFTVLRAV